jgi:hypothetical protein
LRENVIVSLKYASLLRNCFDLPFQFCEALTDFP